MTANFVTATGPCDGVECPACQYCDPATGNCINHSDGHNDCGAGCQRCADGACVDFDAACPGSCSGGYEINFDCASDICTGSTCTEACCAAHHGGDTTAYCEDKDGDGVKECHAPPVAPGLCPLNVTGNVTISTSCHIAGNMFLSAGNLTIVNATVTMHSNSCFSFDPGHKITMGVNAYILKGVNTLIIKGACP